jgi:hypothetical protein
MNFISEEADLRDVLKNASKSAHTSAVVVSPDPLSPTLSTFSTAMTPYNTEKHPDHSEPAGERDIQMECLSD